MMSKSVNILHLSDLHLGRLDDDQQYCLVNEKGESMLASEVSKQLRKHFRESIHFLVVSGDFVWNGQDEDQHHKAANVLYGLCCSLDITDPTRVFLVPGNHDIDRSENHVNNRMKKHRERLLYYFYEKNQWKNRLVDLEPYTIDKKHVDDNGKYKTKTRWIFPFNDEKVAFIPLYSQHTEANKPPEKEFKKHHIQIIPGKTEGWPFDRGIIERSQLRMIDLELGKNNGYDDFLKIAIFHHNPLPTPRGDTGDIEFLDLNILGNGPEVLEFLRRRKIQVVLHGHKHQQSLMILNDYSRSDASPDRRKDTMAIIGAPSIGAYEPSDKYNDSIGFNIIEITRSEASTYAVISKFLAKKGDDWEWEVPKRVHVELSKFIHPKEFMTFSEGYKELIHEMVGEDVSGATFLHYYPDTKWGDAFRKFWNPVTLPTIYNDLVDLTKKTGKEETDLKNNIEGIVRSAIESQFHTPDLLNIIRSGDVWNAFVEAFTTGGKYQNHFLQHIVDTMKDEVGYRQANYMVEPLLCSLNRKFYITKCIYFPCSSSHIENAQEKFVWMLESILIARNLDNFEFAWLPFGISGYEGKSLVSLVFGESNPVPHDFSRDKIETTIFVGYSPKEKSKISVLCLDRNRKAYQSNGGPLFVDLRALMRKIIHPLSQRLFQDFPIYKNGQVYIGNIEKLASLCNVKSEIWSKYQSQLMEAFSGKINDYVMIREDTVRQMYSWVVPISSEGNNGTLPGESGADEKYVKNVLQEKLSIPWSENDFKEIMIKLVSSQ